MRGRIEANYKNLERTQSWVMNADTKASLILAFNGGLFAHLVTKTPEIRALLFRQGLMASSIVILVMSGLFILFFIISIANCFKTIWPAIDGKIPSIFYFGTIQRLGLEEFKKRIRNLTEDGVEEELINQTYIVSTIACKKFTSVRKALINLILSLFSWGGILVTFNFL